MIVGESDGSVLSNRLSADSRCRVLLQEASGEGRHYLIHMKVSFTKPTYLLQLLAAKRIDGIYHPAGLIVRQGRSDGQAQDFFRELLS